RPRRTGAVVRDPVGCGRAERGPRDHRPHSVRPRGSPLHRVAPGHRVCYGAAMLEPESVTTTELVDAWPVLSAAERVEGFGLLPRAEAESLFFALDARGQAEVIRALPEGERR